MNEDLKFSLALMLAVVTVILGMFGSCSYSSVKCTEAGGQFNSRDWGCHERGTKRHD